MIELLIARQTETTVLNLVMSSKLRVAPLTSSLELSYDLHDILLLQKEA